MGRRLGNFRRKSRATTALLLVVGMTAIGGGAVLAESVAASPTLALGRISGPDRYATAVDIARATFASPSAPTPVLTKVIMATGTNYPDALTASYLAGELGTAILLTNPGSLPAATRAGLVSFKTRSVDIVGGPAAVNNSVVDTLTGMGIKVSRIFGQDGCTSCSRFDTMESVDTLRGTTPGTAVPVGAARVAGAAGGPVPGAPRRTAILATANNFPDALAAGPLAVADHFPIILTAGAGRTLSPQARAVISAEKITNLIVVGGPAAINPAQYDNLAGITLDTSATHGANRSQTSELLALDAVAHYGLSDTVLNIANGYDPSFKGLVAVPAGPAIDLGDMRLGTRPEPPLASIEANRGRALGRGGGHGASAVHTPPAHARVGPNARKASGLLGAMTLDGPTLAPQAGLVGFTPDALAGAVLGGTGAPLAPTLITDSPTSPGYVVSYVRAQSSHLVQGDVFGGTSAVSPSAISKILAAVPGAAGYSTAALGQRTPATSTAGRPGSLPATAASVAVRTALAQQGVPYVYGGSTPAGFDCSGLVMYAWAAAGVSLPHSSESQFYDTTQVPTTDLAPGDLVFYNGTPPGHVAMYVGGGKVVEANTTGTDVMVQSLYYDGTPVGFGQVG